MRGVLIAVTAAWLAAGCEEEDLAVRWDDAEKVAITQSASAGSHFEGYQASVSATARPAGLEALYSKVILTCGRQTEAFLKTSDGRVDLLFQPEGNPLVVADCYRLYDLSASIDVGQGDWEVRVWWRSDSSKDPWLAGSQSVTVP